MAVNIAVAVDRCSETEFASLVDEIAGDPGRRDELTALLREDHPVYDQRGTATVVRMRGWILVAMVRTGVPDSALIFILEELDNGADAYLVAAAARALRHYHAPDAVFAPFVVRALANIRYRDEPVSFNAYGEYSASSTDTSAVGELLPTLAWLGPLAQGVLSELESIRAEAARLPRRLRLDLDRAMRAIRSPAKIEAATSGDCCGATLEAVRHPAAEDESRRDPAEIADMILQDHAGESITFREFFQKQPAIVAFFYTRCDNPLKCSLTISKLARVQALLEAQGVADRIRTAAITYDPAFDLPERLRVYGRDRGMRLSAQHRLLRATRDNDALGRYFALGVNFIESLVNRHRVELYILDADGRVATSFERIQWDEQQVVARAVEVLNERGVPA